MNLREHWMIYALGSAFFAALTALFGKIGVAGVPSNLATLVRTVVILGVATALVAWRGEWRAPATIEPKTWLFLVLSGIATGLSWLCYYRALQTGPASVVVPIDKLSILVSIAFSRLVLGERLNLRAGLGLGLLTAGTLLLVFL